MFQMRTTVLLVALAATTFAAPSCGQTPVNPNLSTERIVGGQTAVPYSWPWQIVLCTNQWFGGCALECGGTIIDNAWAMVDAQCIYNINPKVYQVKAAIYKEDATNESGEQISNVKAIHIHPEYQKDLWGTLSNDIALIELTTPLKYSDHVQPICLPVDDKAAIAKPNSAYVTGWGDTSEDGKVLLQLRQVKVPFLDYPTCEKEYPGRMHDDIMVCAGARGFSFSMGDRGGPLVVQGDSGSWFQVGIASWGESYADEGNAEVYSRVCAFCDFISTTTSGKVTCQPIA